MQSRPTQDGPGTIVFALSSTGEDVYAAMARLAVNAVRLSNPDLRIVLLCDHVTAGSAAFANGPLPREVDEVVVDQTPESTSLLRSRHLKTRMRQLVNGPFLFLDIDVLVRGDLSEVFKLDCDVAAAVNHSTDDPSRQMWEKHQQVFDMMRWARDEQHYLNSGVVFFNDTPAALKAGASWTTAWYESMRRTGKHYDQPAFNAALTSSGAHVAVLPHTYNAQIASEPSSARDARVWHYYSSGGTDEVFQFHVEAQRLMRTGSFDRRRLERTVAAKHPWARTNITDDIVAQNAIRNGGLSAWHRQWFLRSRISAVKTWWRNRIRR